MGKQKLTYPVTLSIPITAPIHSPPRVITHTGLETTKLGIVCVCVLRQFGVFVLGVWHVVCPLRIKLELESSSVFIITGRQYILSYCYYHTILFQLGLGGRRRQRRERREREREKRKRKRERAAALATEWAQYDIDPRSNHCSCSFGHRVGPRWLKQQSL